MKKITGDLIAFIAGSRYENLPEEVVKEAKRTLLDIEWIAKQPWCNAGVAMMGASGYGVMQWMTAPLNFPHLKALVVLATTDHYRGLCYPGGVLRKPFVLQIDLNDHAGGHLAGTSSR